MKNIITPLKNEQITEITKNNEKKSET